MEKRVYQGNWNSWQDVSNDFLQQYWLKAEEQKVLEPEPEYIWAAYEQDGYDGSALVVFKRDNVWYQVNGSHCSCYGLEGQWEPDSFIPEHQFQALKEGKAIVSSWGVDTKGFNAWFAEVAQR